MKELLNRIHARVGDLWWYSAMIFIACRSGDVIQAFIGLWLVPKYVGPEELGAVLPLQQLTSFLTVPLGIVAVVFAKYVNTYATRGEYGKVKSFIRDVFSATLILFIVCIGGAYIIMPFFYERLRISSGSLTFLILLCGLIGNIGTIVSSAQQGLKRFKMMSINSILSAPIRLVTMLVAMPIRALSGYILGQTTPNAVTIGLALFDIRKALKPYSPDKSWRRDIPEVWHYMWPYAICTIITSLTASIIATVYRQRLPEIESSANYMLSRFAEIAGFLGCSLNAILFPLASEAYESGKENYRPVFQAALGSIAFSLILAIIFAIIAPTLFSSIETWCPYKDFIYILPIMTICTGLSLAITAITSYELACRRIIPFVTTLAINCIHAIIVVTFTGFEFFRGILPDTIVDNVCALRIARLSTLTYLSLASCLIQLTSLLIMICIMRPKIFRRTK